MEDFDFELFVKENAAKLRKDASTAVSKADFLEELLDVFKANHLVVVSEERLAALTAKPEEVSEDTKKKSK